MIALFSHQALHSLVFVSFPSLKKRFLQTLARAFEVLSAIISLEIELTDFGIILDHVMALRKYHWLMGI